MSCCSKFASSVPAGTLLPFTAGPKGVHWLNREMRSNNSIVADFYLNTMSPVINATGAAAIYSATSGLVEIDPQLRTGAFITFSLLEAATFVSDTSGVFILRYVPWLSVVLTSWVPGEGLDAVTSTPRFQVYRDGASVATDQTFAQVMGLAGFECCSTNVATIKRLWAKVEVSFRGSTTESSPGVFKAAWSIGRRERANAEEEFGDFTYQDLGSINPLTFAFGSPYVSAFSPIATAFTA